MQTSALLKKGMLGAIALGMAATGYFVTMIPQAKALTDIEDVPAGSLIRSTSFSAVYYMSVDGMRYVFPNFKTYETWYGDDFSDVIWISDDDLYTIQIGGNVTYKPGVRMIKIDSDPKTYAVEKGGILRHVTSESLAISLYGSDWNKQIDDVPDGFFSNYTIGEEINDSDDFSASTAEASVDDIDDDKDRLAPAEISITSSGFSPLDVTILPGQNVRFTNDASDKHSATADDLSWGTGTLQAGESFLVRFKEDGVFPFFDQYDSSSTGAIYVE